MASYEWEYDHSGCDTYVQLRSQSTGQHFLLFIDQGDNLPEPRPGGFNRYGLSQGGSVPWF